MNRDEALEKLKELAELSKRDAENAHEQADDVLLELIGDDEVMAAFKAIKKCYA